MNRLTLSKKVLLEKEFDVDIKGYKCHDVDMFIDYIIGDYENFDSIVEEYETKIADLDEIVDDYSKKIEELAEALETSQAQLKELEEKGVMNFANIERMGKIEEQLAKILDEKK